MIEVNIEQSWKAQLKQEFEKPYFNELIDFVKNEYKTKPVFPLAKNVFKAFEQCSFDQVKVVILGQDPYHGPNQANGLCFSVNDGVSFPPSLKNIFKELESDLGLPIPPSGNLERWASQGVLMLNATLTVEAHKAGSHQKKGWELFTDAVIKKVADQKEKVVFILWGNYAQKKGQMIDIAKHCVLKSAHPSPLSAYNGFWNSKPFSKTNTYLQETDQEPINW